MSKRALDYPDDVYCRTGLADLLIDFDQANKAESIYREALKIDAKNDFSRGGLARALAVQGARSRDLELRDEAKRILQELADEGNDDARFRLLDFDDHWERATTDRAVTFRRETDERHPQVRQSGT